MMIGCVTNFKHYFLSFVKISIRTFIPSSSLYRLSSKILLSSIFYFLISSLHSAEVILQSGDVFQCEVLFEETSVVRIKFKDKVFDIPKKEILSIDKTKMGAHASYKLSSIILQDGSTLKGQIAEDTESKIVLQTKLGYLSLDKKQILKTEKNSSKDFYPPKEYLETSFKNRETKLGISFVGGGDSLGSGIGGGGLFIEPVWLNFRNKWQIGCAGDHFKTINARDIEISNGYVYLQYRVLFSEKLDFYTSLGVGGSYIKFKTDEQSFGGLNPLGNFNFGWQGLKFGNFQFRVGVKAFGVSEKNSYGYGGVEFGFIYRI